MRALEQFKSLLSGRPSQETRALTHLAQASALSAQGDLDGAMAQLHTAIALSPAMPEPHYRLGRCLLKKNSDAAAVSALTDALVRTPPYPLALHCQVFLAVANSRLGLGRGEAAFFPPPALPEKPPLLSVIICSIDERRFQQASALYMRLLERVPHEIIGIHDARSLCEGYNRGVARSKGDILIFSHDDVDILTPDFAARLVASLDRHDLIGAVGATHLSGATWFGCGWPNLRGQVGVPADDGAGTVANFFGTYGLAAESVQVMDGFFLAARRELALQLPFDEKTFDGWHLYDIDFSFSAHLKGYRCAIANDQVMTHASRGKFDEKWGFYRDRFLKKHEHHLTFTGPVGFAQLVPPAIAMPSTEEWLSITKHLILAGHRPC